MPKKLGYARISSRDGQDAASQKTILEKLGAVVVFIDAADGSSLNGRDQLEIALQLLQEGDTLVALHPDRLARDTADLLAIAKRVVGCKAVLEIDDPKIIFDGSDIMGEVMLTLFGMIGMVEKHFIKARQRRGIEAAKIRGAYKGRVATINVELIKSMKAGGARPVDIARELKIARASVYRALCK